MSFLGFFTVAHADGGCEMETRVVMGEAGVGLTATSRLRRPAESAAGADDSTGKAAGSTISSGRGRGGTGVGRGGAAERLHSVHTSCIRCRPRVRRLL